MKILIISQNYYPEQFRINDISKELVKRGHNVTVLTGLPNYPEGKIYEGYENNKKRDEIIDGVRVIRVNERPRKSGSAINLFLNYYSFVFSSKKYVKKLDKDFDVVLINQLSPVMQAKAGIKYKKKFGTRTILYCLDLWPASLVAGGVKKNSIITKIYKHVSNKIYKGVDKILVSSKMFKDYFKEEFGFNKEELVYLPQYAEDIFKQDELEIKNKPKGHYDLVFAGNIGKMQSVETIIKTANEMLDYDITFHIVGGGSALDRCKKMANGTNIVFYGQRPLDEMPKFYGIADAMLVSLKKDDLISMTLPGKVQTYLACGKPIIASGDNELKNTILEANCGFCASAENVTELKECIIRFIDSKEKVQLGKNARKYYENNFTKELFFEKLEKVLGEK